MKRIFKSEPITLAVLIAAAVFFAIRIGMSPASLWLRVPVCIAFAVIALACLDTLIAITRKERSAR